jgi:hypothetical protein
MKLFALAFLLTPALLPASSVLYSLDVGNKNLVSFVTQDFLTDRTPVQDGFNRSWELIPLQMIHSPCDDRNIGSVFCSVFVTDFDNLNIGIRAIQRYADGQTNNLLQGIPTFPIHLNRFGRSNVAGANFSISPTDLAATVSPEPSTFLLLGMGLMASWFWRARLAETVRNRS